MAAAGAWGVRGPADVCLCCRGVCGGRALGAADAGAGGGKACGVQAGTWLPPSRVRGGDTSSGALPALSGGRNVVDTISCTSRVIESR